MFAIFQKVGNPNEHCGWLEVPEDADASLFSVLAPSGYITVLQDNRPNPLQFVPLPTEE